MTDKPLFVALKAKYFDQFVDGSKKVEYRRYGPGWNERTCRIGRRVTLSKGYGRHHRRLTAIIERIELGGIDMSAEAAKLYAPSVRLIGIHLKDIRYAGDGKQLTNQKGT